MPIFTPQTAGGGGAPTGAAGGDLSQTYPNPTLQGKGFGTRPFDAGLINWNFDPSSPGMSSSAAGTAGIMYLARVELPDPATTITNVHIALGTAATTPANAFAGIYDSSGTRQGVSLDQSSLAWTGTATPLKTIALTSAWSKAATSRDFAWVAVLTGSAGAMPGFFRANNSILSNGLSTVAQARFSSFGSAQTALPTSFTPASLLGPAGAQYLWAAIS